MDEKYIEKDGLITNDMPVVVGGGGCAELVEVELYPGVSVKLRPGQVARFEGLMATQKRRGGAANKARRLASQVGAEPQGEEAPPVGVSDKALSEDK